MLKNATVELMLSLDDKSYSFSAAISNCFFKIHISLIPVRLYMTDDRFDNFSLTADKFRVRSTGKGFFLCSQMMKQ